jgi:hypothetical protein
MKTYRVPVTWMVFGTVDVQAESKMGAIAKVIADGLAPDEPEYADGSASILEGLVAEVKEDGSLDTDCS